MEKAIKLISQGLAMLYLSVAFILSMPEGFPLRHWVAMASEPLMRFSGLWQGWAMFAPNPISEDIYVSARVSFSDGSHVDWDLSRMNKMGYGQRYAMERWRKWANDNLRLDDNKALWPAAGLWIARELASDYALTATGVELTRHWHPAAIPFPDGTIPDRSGWNQHVFYKADFAH